MGTDYRIGTLHYNGPMFAHESQAFSTLTFHWLHRDIVHSLLFQ